MNAVALSNLARANKVRLAAAQLRRDLTAGRITLQEALDDPASGSLTVWWLVQALPGVARGTASYAIRYVGCSQSRRVRDLTERQRDRLLAFVEGVLA